MVRAAGSVELRITVSHEALRAWCDAVKQLGFTPSQSRALQRILLEIALVEGGTVMLANRDNTRRWLRAMFRVRMGGRKK